MGILDWLRGAEQKKNDKKNLPAPSPVAPTPTPPAPQKQPVSDIPPIRPKRERPIHEEIKTYDAPHKMPQAHPTLKQPVQSRPRVERPAPPEDLKHIFISADEYSTVMENANVVRSKLLETDERLQQLSAIRATEEKELLKWQEQLVSLEKKLTYMEAVLDKAGEV